MDGTVKRLGSLQATSTTKLADGATGTLIVPVAGLWPSVTLAGRLTVKGRAATLKVLLLPPCPLPSEAHRAMPAATCETVRLPVHTPPARVAVVGATVTGVPIDSRILGIYESAYG